MFSMLCTEFVVCLRRLGMTQRRFAAYIGQTEINVSRWATGRNDIPLWVKRLLDNMLYVAVDFDTAIGEDIGMLAFDEWDTLGLCEGASSSQIKAAYRKLSKLYHPDSGGHHEAFVQIQRAYDALRGL